MKVSVVILASAATLAAGQSDPACAITSIPACAQPAINAAVTSATKCSTTDYVCICNSQQALTGAATSGVLAACGQDVALNQVLPAVTAFCKAQLGGQCGSSASGSASGSAGATSSSAAVTTSSVTSTSSATLTTVAPTTTTTNGTSPAKSTTATAGAALAGSIGSFGMMVLGALAAF